VNQKVYRVLFVCSGNCGRSVMAEAILQHLGGALFDVHSAGTHPTGRINPLALEELTQRGYPTSHLHSKSWDAFVRPDSPALDLVVILCPLAAQEPQPTWPGQPLIMEWNIPSPGAVQGSENRVRAAFRAVCQQVEDAIKLYLTFPLESPGRPAAVANITA
jgi:arsenate reductase